MKNIINYHFDDKYMNVLVKNYILKIVLRLHSEVFEFVIVNPIAHYLSAIKLYILGNKYGKIQKMDYCTVSWFPIHYTKTIQDIKFIEANWKIKNFDLKKYKNFSATLINELNQIILKNYTPDDLCTESIIFNIAYYNLYA